MKSFESRMEELRCTVAVVELPGKIQKGCKKDPG